MTASHRVMPPTRYAWAMERGYQRDINGLVRSWRKIVEKYLNNQFKDYLRGGVQMLQDADHDASWIGYIQQELDLMKTELQHSQTDTELNKITKRFVYSIDKFSADNVNTQLSTIGLQTGIQSLNPVDADSDLAKYVRWKISQNTGLIKIMRDRYADQIQGDIYQSITSGGGIGQVYQAIIKRTGMAMNHAALVANDQTGTILSQLDAYRSKKAGAEKYVWRSMEDNLSLIHI